MTRSTLLLLLVAACSRGPAAKGPDDGPTIASVAELGALMKNEINPAFSRLTFLLLHGESVEDNAEALGAELGRSASRLRGAIAKLRAWTHVPAKTEQGREVFFTFAESVDQMTEKLVVRVSRGEREAAQGQLEQIADTCNNCHHFFRLKIEDSVVPSRSAHLDPAKTVVFTQQGSRE